MPTDLIHRIGIVFGRKIYRAIQILKIHLRQSQTGVTKNT
jgi:hypothetical protein